MNAKQLVDELGGVKEVAKLASCSIQAVYAWQRAGVIPEKSLRMLRLARPKVFKAIDAQPAKAAQ